MRIRKMIWFLFISLFYGCSGTTVSDGVTSMETTIDEDAIVVYFESNGGSSVEPLINPEISDLEDLPLSFREGYILMGWYVDEALTEVLELDWSFILETMTLYAKWESIEGNDDVITISLMLNSGTAPYNQIPMYQANPFDVTLTPTREGYTFRGWFYDAALRQHYDPYRDFDEDTTLYAGWVEGDYTLIYDEEDFLAIADDLSGHYLLMTWLSFPGPAFRSDIDEYTVIGDETEPFSGILDGNHWGIQIQYLLMDYTSSNIGLFGVITGTIRNLELAIWNEFTPYSMNEAFNFGGLAGTLRGSVEDSTFHVEQSFNLNHIDGEVNIGMIAGVIDGGHLSNVLISRGATAEIIVDNTSMSSGSQTFNIGTICGKAIDSSFENVVANGAIDVWDDYTTSADVNVIYALGGAIGRGIHTTLTWVGNDETWSDVSPGIYSYAENGAYYVGGLIGHATDCAMEKVYSLQYVALEFDVSGLVYIGGLLGYASNCDIDRAYASGAEMGGYENYMDNSFSHVGGLIGYAGDCTIFNVYSDLGAYILDIGNGQVHLAGLIATMDHSSISLGFTNADITVYCLLDPNMITIAYLVASANMSSMNNLYYTDGSYLILNFVSVSDTGYGSALDYDSIMNYLDALLLEFEGNDWYDDVYNNSND